MNSYAVRPGRHPIACPFCKKNGHGRGESVNTLFVDVSPERFAAWDAQPGEYLYAGRCEGTCGPHHRVEVKVYVRKS